MSLSIVYPNGTTISVQSPAYTLLTSGSTPHPVNCPIAITWECLIVIGKQGRVLVLGSSDIFADDWLDKEEISQLRMSYSVTSYVKMYPLIHQWVGQKGLRSRHIVTQCPGQAVPPREQLAATGLLCNDLFGLMSLICTNN